MLLSSSLTLESWERLHVVERDPHRTRLNGPVSPHIFQVKRERYSREAYIALREHNLWLPPACSSSSSALVSGLPSTGGRAATTSPVAMSLLRHSLRPLEVPSLTSTLPWFVEVHSLRIRWVALALRVFLLVTPFNADSLGVALERVT